MRLRRRRERRRDTPDPATEDTAEIGELVPPSWYAHADTTASTTFSAMMRRLPALVTLALRLAWQANRLDTAVAVGFNVAAGVFTAFGLLATTGVLQALLAAGPTPQRVREALPALLLVGGAVTIRSVLSAGAGWAQSRLEPQVERVAQRKLYALCARIDLTCFDDSDFHDALERAEARGLAAVPAIVRSTIDVITGLVGVAAAAGVLGVLHPILLPLLVGSALPDGWAAVRAARLRYLTNYAMSASRRRKWIISDLMTDRPPAPDARSYTMADFLLGEWDRVAAVEQDAELRLARRETFARVGGDAAGGVATAGVYLALGVLLALGALPLAVAGAAVLAIRTGQSSLNTLMFAVNRCYEEGLYFTDNVNFTRQATPHLPQPSAKVMPDAFETIRAEGVGFTYPGSDSPALCEVSIQIRKGEVVALVGENGSGKSTLAKIVAGLYAPDHGSIHWDDVPVGEVDPEQLRRRIAVIAQDYARWPLTARTNITLHRRSNGSASNGAGETDRLRRAATAAGADTLIADLPHGYDTLLDRRFTNGVELSSGQWQRIAVARGFYRDAPLLICDEPTAALDARAEHALFETIRHHVADRTVLLITHRLASVRHADRIYVLDHGRVTEQGTHAELMANGRLYADLYSLQASAYQDH